MELQDLQEGDHTTGLRSTMIWTWIGEMMSLIRRTEPQVTPPMYVRLLFLCHGCMHQVEALKTNLTVQIPFIYAHMLAVLVHVMNLLLAVSGGLSLGSAMAEIHDRTEAADKGIQKEDHGLVGEFYEATQTVSVQIILLIVQPMLYQSFLQIADGLCYPFGDELNHLTTETFIGQLHKELQTMAEGKVMHQMRRTGEIKDIKEQAHHLARKASMDLEKGG